ncbi:MAG: FtsX-like permease family protein [Dermatophilaceae bacterium]
MTTTTPVQPDAAAPPPEDPSPPGPGRFAQWHSTWSVALRMARRDVRRHRGRSALAVVMVAVPTTLLAALVTFTTTSEVSGTELIGLTMGNGQALLSGPDQGRVVQGADPNAGSSTGPEAAREVTGFDREGSAFVNADAVSTLVGAPVAPVATFSGSATVDDRRLRLDFTALDGRVGLGERLQLASGRWPTAAREALVTRAELARGVPSSGPLAVTVGTETTALVVVGVAEIGAMSTAGGLVVLEPLPGSAGTASAEWIVRGNDPVTWPELRRLGEHGFTVTSAAVLRDPPSDAELRAIGLDSVVAGGDELQLVVALGTVMVFITCILLVGPAFAVSAARQRRTLALAASNGATTAVLRRTVLAQAVVLGGVSATLGPLLGIALSHGIVLWTRRNGAGIQAPFDPRPALLLGIAGCALLSTVVAALMPARRLGRLDIVGVMRGQSVSPRPSTAVFVLGMVLSAAGGALLVAATGAISGPPLPPESGGYLSPSVLGVRSEYAVTVGAVALILGALFLVPLILAGVGRLGSRLPTSMRMAARDLARHRARSAPSVAAVLAAVAGLTFGLTGLESDTEQRQAEYLPSTLPGEALVSTDLAQQVDAEQVRSVLPDAVVTENRVLDIGDPTVSGAALTEPYRLTFVSVVPAGCTTEQTLGVSAAPEGSAQIAERCSRSGSTDTTTTSVLLLPADELVRRLSLDAADAAAVRAGAAVARGIDGPTVRIARGTFRQDPSAPNPVAPDVRVEQDRTVPLVRVPTTKAGAGSMLQASLAFASDGPTARDWPSLVRDLTVRTADGRAITDEQAERVQARVGDESYVAVERGFQRDDRLVVGILLGVFALLILVVTLTSTALTLTEQQTDQATLAALGATRGTRRVMAAGQALMLAVVGCVLGVAVGLVPGIAIAKPLTSASWDPLTGQPIASDGVLAIPWLALGILGILVPLLAALLAAAGIRRAPIVTRRAG